MLSTNLPGEPIALAGEPRTRGSKSINTSTSPALLSIPEVPEWTFDEGFFPWLQVLGSFFLFFNSWGVINTWGAYQTYYKQYLLSDISSSSIAWVGSLQSFLLMVIGVVTGPLFDMGYFHTLLSFGAIMLTFGLMMTSLVSEFWQLILTQGICVGLGAGCLLVPAIAILPQYFQKKMGLATGLAVAGSSIGGVVYPIAFDQLQRRVGFPWANRALGFLCFGTICFSLSIMRARFVQKQTRRLYDMSAFKEPAYCLFAAAMFLGYLGFYNFLFYVQSYAMEEGIRTSLGFCLLPMVNGASALGRIGPNIIADHLGPTNVLMPTVAVTAMLAFIWIRVHTASGIIILAIFYGFFSGGMVSLSSVVVANITTNKRDMGTRLGQIFAVTSIGVLVGTPIGGSLLNTTEQYLAVQLFTGCSRIASASLVASVRVVCSGPKLIAKV
ncbi:putative MFS monocarboxylate transporter [Trichoderma velutinum]